MFLEKERTPIDYNLPKSTKNIYEIIRNQKHLINIDKVVDVCTQSLIISSFEAKRDSNKKVIDDHIKLLSTCGYIIITETKNVIQICNNENFILKKTIEPQFKKLIEDIKKKEEDVFYQQVLNTLRLSTNYLNSIYKNFTSIDPSNIKDSKYLPIWMSRIATFFDIGKDVDYDNYHDSMYFGINIRLEKKQINPINLSKFLEEIITSERHDACLRLLGTLLSKTMKINDQDELEIINISTLIDEAEDFIETCKQKFDDMEDIIESNLNVIDNIEQQLTPSNELMTLKGEINKYLSNPLSDAKSALKDGRGVAFSEHLKEFNTNNLIISLNINEANKYLERIGYIKKESDEK